MPTDHLLGWLVLLSVVTFIGTLVLVPVLLIRLPADYFVSDRRIGSAWKDQHPAARVVLIILKNALGGLLTLGGIVMLLTPGQGILSILIGLSLMDFPGKFALERRLIRRRSVSRAINWIRAKAGREPIEIPDAKKVKAIESDDGDR